MNTSDAKVVELAKELDQEVDKLEMKYQMLMVAHGANPIAAQQVVMTVMYTNFLRGKKAHEYMLKIAVPEEVRKEMQELLNNALAEASEALEKEVAEKVKALDEKFLPIVKALRDGK